MFRVTLLLLTAALVLALGWDKGLFEPTRPDNPLVSADEGDTNPLRVMNRPAMRVYNAPNELIRTEDGTLDVQAEPPAVPGSRIILNTAGAYGMGYVRVSEGVLDEDLRATLRIPGRKFLGSFKYWTSIPASATYQEGTSATFAIAIVTAPPPPAPTCAGHAPLKADGTAWECTYNDEFDTGRLDRRSWYVLETETAGTTSGTKWRYACAVDSEETVHVADGKLELSLIEYPEVRKCGKRKSSAFAYGQVMHYQTFSQTYGKYEVRAKIPDIQVPGVQQSFWLWPKKNKYGSWPHSGEIDFAEMYSSAPGMDKPFIHYTPGESAGGTKNTTHGYCPIKVGQYNTYGVEWEPGRITILLNDEVCFVNDYESATAGIFGKYAPFNHPFYLAMNQAMGTLGNEYDADLVPDRVTTLVDYVRIWK